MRPTTQPWSTVHFIRYLVMLRHAQRGVNHAIGKSLSLPLLS